MWIIVHPIQTICLNDKLFFNKSDKDASRVQGQYVRKNSNHLNAILMPEF